MTNKPIIKHIVHPHAWQLHQSRKDEAICTGQSLTENPHWLQDIDTGRLFHAIYGCIGYPTEIQDKGEEMPGYIALVGIVRPDDSLQTYNPLDAKFLLLAEFQSKDVSTLFDKVIELREKYGYGTQPELLRVWYGDPDRFLTTLVLYNERLARNYGNENNAVLITPPVDMYEPKAFDNYVRSLKSCLMPENVRFYFGGLDILKNCLREFRRDSPAVFAIGGLVHSLLTTCTWMSETGNNMFAINEDESYG